MLMVPFVFAQKGEQTPPEPRTVPVIGETQAPVISPAEPIVPDGTQVWLRLADEVKVKHARVGDKVHFLLYTDLYYRQWLLAKSGTPVEASIEGVNQAKRLNRGSNISIGFQGITLLNQQVLPLTGVTKVKGGVGTGGQIASGIADSVGRCSDCPCALFVIPALPTAFVLGVVSKGENRNAKMNLSAPTFVDGDFQLDLQTLQKLEQPSGMTGRVIIVRGIYGWPYSRDLYCNGVPLAHLNSSRHLELDLNPGYYRFSIQPKNGFMQIFVNAGSEIRLLTDHENVYELNEFDIGTNTNKFARKRTAGQLVKESRPVDQADLYTTSCGPLREQNVP